MQCGCIGNVCRTLGIIGYIKRILEKYIQDNWKKLLFFMKFLKLML